MFMKSFIGMQAYYLLCNGCDNFSTTKAELSSLLNGG